MGDFVDGSFDLGLRGHVYERRAVSCCVDPGFNGGVEAGVSLTPLSSDRSGFDQHNVVNKYMLSCWAKQR